MAVVLVTGALGAIGRSVTKAVIAAGDQVIGLGHGTSGDRCQTIPAMLRWVNGEVDGDNLRSHRGGIWRMPAMRRSTLPGGSLVGPSIVRPAEDFPSYGRVHVSACWNGCALEAPGCRLVLVSSAAVYGDSHRLPIRRVGANESDVAVRHT